MLSSLASFTSIVSSSPLLNGRTGDVENGASDSIDHDTCAFLSDFVAEDAEEKVGAK